MRRPATLLAAATVAAALVRCPIAPAQAVPALVGPAPVGLLALGALASRAGVQTNGSTIGGGNPVSWTGAREQFVASGLFDQVRFPKRAGQVRTKEGLIGRLRVAGDQVELAITSPRGAGLAKAQTLAGAALWRARVSDAPPVAQVYCS